jgi:hypothetical protein
MKRLIGLVLTVVFVAWMIVPVVLPTSSSPVPNKNVKKVATVVLGL